MLADRLEGGVVALREAGGAAAEIEPPARARLRPKAQPEAREAARAVLLECGERHRVVALVPRRIFAANRRENALPCPDLTSNVRARFGVRRADALARAPPLGTMQDASSDLRAAHPVLRQAEDRIVVRNVEAVERVLCIIVS